MNMKDNLDKAAVLLKTLNAKVAEKLPVIQAELAQGLQWLKKQARQYCEKHCTPKTTPAADPKESASDNTPKP